MTKVESDGHIQGLKFIQYVFFLFLGNQTIFGRDKANSVFDLENSRSRSWWKSYDEFLECLKTAYYTSAIHIFPGGHCSTLHTCLLYYFLTTNIFVLLANSTEKQSFITADRLFVYNKNNKGPGIDPCGTPHFSVPLLDLAPLQVTYWSLFDK